MPSELSLTWDDHPKTLLGVFEKLLETSTLVDCTIAAEGQYLKAHKIILSACSPYFQLLFSQENEKNPIIVLKDIKFQELKAMIDFIYRGKVKVPEERLGDFVDAAESLQIKGLGSGNSQKTSSHGTGNGNPDIQKRWSHTSPLPHKRQRRTDFQDGLRRAVNVVNFESKTSEGQSNEIRVEAPNLCQDETRLSVSSAINSPTSLPSDVSNEMKNFEVTKSVSFEKIPLSPCEETHPNSDSVVVKSELEAVTEVDIQEPDFYIEPKEEEIAEEQGLEATGGETNSEIATNQFPDFSAMLQSTSTRPETVILPLDSTSSMGGVPSLASSGASPERHQSSATGCAPALAVSERLGDGGDIFRRLDALEDQSEETVSTGDCCAPPPLSSTPCLPKPPVLRNKKKRPRRHCCSECGKSYTAPSRLLGHLRTHTGDRLFACEMCGKQFPMKQDLHRHSRFHMGERPYNCEVCGKGFKLSIHLQVHLRLHTDERPYSCNVCGKSFRQMISMQRHQRQHIG